MCVCTSAGAQELDAEETGVTIQDTREVYRVGVLRFESESLSRELEYLLVSLPELFTNELQKITDHSYDSDEQEFYQRTVHQQRIQAAEQRLATLLAAYDQRLFSGDDNISQQKERDDEIADARVDIEALRRYSPSDIDITNPKQLEIVNLVEEYPLRRPSYRTIADTHNADLLFEGTVDQNSEFVRLTIRYYYRAQRQERAIETVSAAQDEINQLGERVNDRIADIVIGRAWSSISIIGVSEQDTVYIDDMLAGYGSQILRYLPWGEYTIRVESENSDRPQTRQVVLSGEEIVTLQFEDQNIEKRSIAIESMPSGATVYVNSTWQGETPLTIDRPRSESTLLLRKPGYFDVKRTLGDDSRTLDDESRTLDDASEERLSYLLTPEIFDQGEWLLSRRDRFYAALTALVLSVPIPIILNGVYENSNAFRATAQYRGLPIAEQRTINTTANVTQVGGYVGIFISVTLAINAIVEAVRYVRAANFFHQL